MKLYFGYFSMLLKQQMQYKTSFFYHSVGTVSGLIYGFFGCLLPAFQISQCQRILTVRDFDLLFRGADGICDFRVFCSWI